MCRINDDESVVEHFGLGSLRRYWSVSPSKSVGDGVEARGVVCTGNPSCRSGLRFPCCFYVIWSVRAPNSSGKLDDLAVKDSISCFFDFLVSDVYISSEEAECRVCFVADGIYLKSTEQVPFNVFCRGIVMYWRFVDCVSGMTYAFFRVAPNVKHLCCWKLIDHCLSHVFYSMYAILKQLR